MPNKFKFILFLALLFIGCSNIGYKNKCGDNEHLIQIDPITGESICGQKGY